MSVATVVGYPKVSQFKTIAQLRRRWDQLALKLLADDEILTAAEGSPLAESIMIGGYRVGNRWCIHPMEGWDADRDGTPSELTLRRWRNFGSSGAKLIWGGEAAAVQYDGRANPNQLLATQSHEAGLATLRDNLLQSHVQEFGSSDDLLIGLQLTHSGRFSRPDSAPKPRIACHHPLLDRKFGLDSNDSACVWTDDELQGLIDRFVEAARAAGNVGFHFVDVKACHGYLLHEFLGARARPGPYGGDFEGRTRLLRSIIERIRDACPRLMICVRLSVFDLLPYETGIDVGRPMAHAGPYCFGFGTDVDNPLTYDVEEPIKLIGVLQSMGVAAVNLSGGSPYYNPHIQRPAMFPPSDGYQPPEDPMVGVARQIEVARQCKAAYPDLPMVGSGYSYLQDYLPHVAQSVVREGWIDLVGLGRMVLAYPRLPSDVLRDGKLARKQICRTFSDCTTAPRNGIVSGCFPLDDYYKQLPEAQQLKALKKSLNS